MIKIRQHLIPLKVVYIVLKLWFVSHSTDRDGGIHQYSRSIIIDEIGVSAVLYPCCLSGCCTPIQFIHILMLSLLQSIHYYSNIKFNLISAYLTVKYMCNNKQGLYIVLRFFAIWVQNAIVPSAFKNTDLTRDIRDNEKLPLV